MKSTIKLTILENSKQKSFWIVYLVEQRIVDIFSLFSLFEIKKKQYVLYFVKFHTILSLRQIFLVYIMYQLTTSVWWWWLVQELTETERSPPMSEVALYHCLLLLVLSSLDIAVICKWYTLTIISHYVCCFHFIEWPWDFWRKCLFLKEISIT